MKDLSWCEVRVAGWERKGREFKNGSHQQVYKMRAAVLILTDEWWMG